MTLLSGAIVDEALASVAIPRPLAGRDLQAEATPTPTPEATPTPTPEATPTPTPEATPTPTPEATPGATPTPTPTTFGAIDVFKVIDTDGNPDTVEDREAPPVWVFDATFEDGVDIVAEDPETDFEEPAHWSFNFAGASTHVVIVEGPQQGFRFQTGGCVTAGPDGGSDVPISVVPGVIFLDVFRTDRDIGLFACTFVNEPGEEVAETSNPTITLPPTSAATRATSPAAGDVRLAVTAVLGLLACALVLTSRGSFPRRSTRRD